MVDDILARTFLHLHSTIYVQQHNWKIKTTLSTELTYLLIKSQVSLSFTMLYYLVVFFYFLCYQLQYNYTS